MKKTLLALAVASISASAFAAPSENAKPTFEFEPIHKKQFSVSGAVGVGGYYDTKTKAMYDDWATAVTVAVSYENNFVVGYLETDLELNWTTDEDKTKSMDIDNEFATDVDKAWLGLDSGYGIFSFGWENDTALDKVDGAGDFTYEFGNSAADASDAFDVIKFEGSTSGIAYGASYFSVEESNEYKGANGYLGLEQDVYNVYVGYESREDKDNNKKDFNVISLSGNVAVGETINLGANAWKNEAEDVSESTGFYLSGSMAMNDKLTLAAGYNFNQEDFTAKGKADEDTSYMNVATMYTFSDRLSGGIDIKQDLEVADSSDKETYVFAAAFYTF
ncbi:hypothetical protein BS333_04985 [Vibrio azureus]|uniref:Porin domain-containing protein n=1 Tax=Vibrio azureus NBRC 104587 TaxID=1219077 RepID=U3A4H3_9VIBR|nr:hypothetical protein [Vibrio azureus]AUI85779.1 hypothetical protein BS333_04985 [Vibrio azureus]GAD74886.1 hypothetical protein VAZ01S_016_00710 [Vibrio azureus NBRC 104587]